MIIIDMSIQTEVMEKALLQMTERVGFKKDIYHYNRPGTHDGFIDMLILNPVDIGKNKNVGIDALIHYDKIEQLYNQLADEPLMKPFPLLSIGHIDPTFRHYSISFMKVAGIPEAVNKIESLIKNKFFKFYYEYEDIERIVGVFENNDIGLMRRFYILPLLYLLIGKPVKGIEVMEPLQRFGIAADEHCKHFYNNYCKAIL